jgi:hypothetical protein
MKYCVCRIDERAWSAPTSSDLVELLVLIFLLVRETDQGPLSNGHYCSCVTLAVFVYGMRCINPPADG